MTLFEKVRGQTYTLLHFYLSRAVHSTKYTKYTKKNNTAQQYWRNADRRSRNVRHGQAGADVGIIYGFYSLSSVRGAGLRPPRSPRAGRSPC